MKTFQCKLPEVKYTVKPKKLNKFLMYLRSWGVDIRDQDLTCGYVTVLCGGLYKVHSKHWVEHEVDAITPKQFKQLVREAVGEPE